MTAVNILVDINCHRPAWAFITDIEVIAEKFLAPLPIYRIYISDNLLTERTWIWDNNNFIQENIWIYAEKDSSHILTLTPVLKNPAQAVFTLTNFTVIDQPFTSEQINDLTISFTL